MKLLTLNTHSWMEEDQEEKIKIVAKIIKQQDYDVISLQEVNQSIKENLVFNNIKEDNFSLLLIKELEKLGCIDYRMVWEFSHLCYATYEEGVSIITKHKIIEEDICSMWVSDSRNINEPRSRKVIRVPIEINKKVIDFYSCHLGWWNDEKESFKLQADKLINSIKKDRLTFLMGDFNNSAFIRNEGYDYLIEKGMKDTFIMAKEKDGGVTVEGKIAGWDLNNKDLRIDLILVNRDIDVKYSKVIFNDKNAPIVSDHYGVEVDIN